MSPDHAQLFFYPAVWLVCDVEKVEQLVLNIIQRHVVGEQVKGVMRNVSKSHKLGMDDTYDLHCMSLR